MEHEVDLKRMQSECTWELFTIGNRNGIDKDIFLD